MAKDRNGPSRSRKTPPKSAYREQYGVIVICKSETHQKRVYNKLNRMGLVCRVVVT